MRARGHVPSGWCTKERRRELTFIHSHNFHTATPKTKSQGGHQTLSSHLAHVGSSYRLHAFASLFTMVDGHLRGVYTPRAGTRDERERGLYLNKLPYQLVGPPEVRWGNFKEVSAWGKVHGHGHAMVHGHGTRRSLRKRACIISSLLISLSDFFYKLVVNGQLSRHSGRRLARSGPRARVTSSHCVATTRTRRRSRFADS